MIWLTWRQFRAQAITAAAALAVFAILLAANEPSLSNLYDSSGLLTCHGDACTGLASTFLENLSSGGGSFLIPGSAYMILYFLGVLVILIAPAIIGVFWGAPLIARELEAGTFRLAWNQSVTRTRWLTVKLVLIGAAAMAVTEAFSLIQAWWAAPISKAVGLGGSSSIFSEGRFGWFVFPTHGITPLGYAAFGFALGVTAGLLARRLDHVQRRRQRRRAAGQHHSRVLRAGGIAGLRLAPRNHGGSRLNRAEQLCGQPRDPGRRKLPARQPLLAAPVARDRDVPGPRPRPGRVLLLAAQPPSILTNSTSVALEGSWSDRLE
jgi:hypothetical protein